MEPIVCIGQLRRDTQPLSGSMDGAIKHSIDIQSSADFTHVDVLASKGKSRGARDHHAGLDSSQRVDQFLSQSFTQVNILGVAAPVQERQHRNGHGATAGARLGSVFKNANPIGLAFLRKLQQPLHCSGLVLELEHRHEASLNRSQVW